MILWRRELMERKKPSFLPALKSIPAIAKVAILSITGICLICLALWYGNVLNFDPPPEVVPSAQTDPLNPELLTTQTDPLNPELLTTQTDPLNPELITTQTDPGNLIYQGEVQNLPWSGWWWPFHVSLPYHLYDPRGPMDKYDALAVAQGLPNPESRAWERQHHYADGPGEEWFGHCNGWAAASVLEPEPQSARTLAGIQFNPSDMKGLLAEWHWWDPAVAFYGSRYDGPGDDIDDIYPHQFHRVLIDFIGEKRRPIIMDIRGGTQETNSPQIWNYPAYRYQMEYQPDRNQPDRTHVRCRVWFAYTAHPDYQGTRSSMKVYYYWITGDQRRPTAGGWERSIDGGWNTVGDSRRDHPDFLWYPASATQHQVLSRRLIDQIISGRG